MTDLQAFAILLFGFLVTAVLDITSWAARILDIVFPDIETKYGFVNTKAEYVYGDSVAYYTPIYVKVNNMIDILSIDSLAVKYGENNWVTCIEPGKQMKEFCEIKDVETWTENGWTRLYRVIRHKLVSSKKMYRIVTPTGLIDVTAAPLDKSTEDINTLVFLCRLSCAINKLLYVSN